MEANLRPQGGPRQVILSLTLSWDSMTIPQLGSEIEARTRIHKGPANTRHHQQCVDRRFAVHTTVRQAGEN